MAMAKTDPKPMTVTARPDELSAATWEQ